MRARNVGDHIEVDAEEARSGQTGVHLRYVLIISTSWCSLGWEWRRF